jgi:hypothetical protein
MTEYILTLLHQFIAKNAIIPMIAARIAEELFPTKSTNIIIQDSIRKVLI